MVLHDRISLIHFGLVLILTVILTILLGTKDVVEIKNDDYSFADDNVMMISPIEAIRKIDWNKSYMRLTTNHANYIGFDFKNSIGNLIKSVNNVSVSDLFKFEHTTLQLSCHLCLGATSQCNLTRYDHSLLFSWSFTSNYPVVLCETYHRHVQDTDVLSALIFSNVKIMHYEKGTKTAEFVSMICESIILFLLIIYILQKCREEENYEAMDNNHV